jgi:hypothetical protein
MECTFSRSTALFRKDVYTLTAWQKRLPQEAGVYDISAFRLVKRIEAAKDKQLYGVLVEILQKYVAGEWVVAWLDGNVIKDAV